MTDPAGVLNSNRVESIPFHVTLAESSIDVILLNRDPENVLFALRTPGGQLITPATVDPAVKFVTTSTVIYYRLSLPALHTHPAGSHAGTWHALLRLRNGDAIGKGGGKIDAPKDLQEAFAKQASFQKVTPVPYSLSVHGRSELTMNVNVLAHGHLPGASVNLVAALAEYAQPVRGTRAKVVAEVTWPDGGVVTIAFNEKYPGRYHGHFDADGAGVYTIRFLAQGKTTFGSPFTREAVRTLAIYIAEPAPSTPPSEGGSGAGGAGGKGGGPGGTPSREECCMHAHGCCHGHHHHHGHDHGDHCQHGHHGCGACGCK